MAHGKSYSTTSKKTLPSTSRASSAFIDDIAGCSDSCSDDRYDNGGPTVSDNEFIDDRTVYDSSGVQGLCNSIESCEKAQIAAGKKRLTSGKKVNEIVRLNSIKSSKAAFWILTIPAENWTPTGVLHDSILYIRGQKEIGEKGFVHWQVVAHFKTQVRFAHVKKIFPPQTHIEPTRSSAANEYVWKEDSAVEDTKFEFGRKPMNRNCKKDWEAIYESAAAGQFDDIPADVKVHCYNNLSKIRIDNVKPSSMEREVVVYWGKTGVGKSRRAWDEAGWDAYPKSPTTKFWMGYQNQPHVVIDEFRGQLDIAHVLTWFDRYPVIVESKGGGFPLKATKLWITSNLHPINWYPNLDTDTLDAFLRRLTIIEVLSI